MSNPKDLIGSKKAALRFVPPALSIVAAPAMSDGVTQYGAYNWRDNKVFFSIYLEAILRHILAIMDGEDRDPDSGHLHLSHIAANTGIIADALYGGNLIDDRPVPGPAPRMLDEQNQGKRAVARAEARAKGKEGHTSQLVTTGGVSGERSEIIRREAQKWRRRSWGKRDKRA